MARMPGTAVFLSLLIALVAKRSFAQREVTITEQGTVIRESLHFQYSSSFLAESACDGLPFRSAFVGCRCFVAVPKGPGAGDSPDAICRALLHGAHHDGFTFVSKPAEIERREVEEELFRTRVLMKNVRYSVTSHYESKSYIEVTEASFSSSSSYSASGSFGQSISFSGSESVSENAREKRQTAEEVVLCQLVGESACPAGYTEVGRKCYKFNAEAVGYDKAVEICERDGGHLPVINNDDENRMIANFARNEKDGIWLATAYLPRYFEWHHTAGRRKTPHYFRWLRYDDSDRSNDHALLISKSGAAFGYWRNVRCGGDTSHPFVCERPAVIGRPPDEIPDYCPSTPAPTWPPTPSQTPTRESDSPPTPDTETGPTDGPETIKPPEPATSGAVTYPPISDPTTKDPICLDCPPTAKPTKDSDGNGTANTEPGPPTDTTAWTDEPTTTGTDLPPLPPANETNPCPMSEDRCQWYHYAPSNKCFMVVIKNTGLETWAQLLDWCRQWNGTLAAIHSFHEQNFVYDLVKANASSCTDAWIGLQDPTGGHKWRWTDGTAYDYTYWELRKPANKGKPTCSRLQMAKDKGLWDDMDCQSRDVGAAVCQFTPHTEWQQQETPAPPVQEPPRTCPAGWELFQLGTYLKCFKVINNPSAVPYQHLFETACNAENGNLAAIHSQAEMDFVVALANRNQNLIGWSNLTWIGLHNPLKQPGKWMWTDGSPYDYRNWQSIGVDGGIQMPDNHRGKQYCTEVKLNNKQGKWDDSNCEVSTIVSAICQLFPGATSPSGNPIVNEPSTSCPGLDWDFFPKTGKCYKFVNGLPLNVNFEYNKKLCEENGGTLVSIHSDAENDYIMRLAKEKTLEVQPGARNAFWIGLFQKGRNPTPWQWVDGSKFDYNKWDKGQPNNAFINGAHLNSFCGFLQFLKYRADVTPGTWDDASCVSPKVAYAVCQFIVNRPPVKDPNPGGGQTKPTKAPQTKPPTCIRNARQFVDLTHGREPVPAGVSRGPCPPNWYYFAGTRKCMAHTWCGGPDFPMFMQHLQLLCSGKGRNADPKKPRPDATMVTISSETENDFVFKLVKRLGRCHEKIWIGLGAPHRPDNWKWLDNRTPWGYHKWAPGIPGNGVYNPKQWAPDKYCAFMYVNGTYAKFWVSGSCTGQKSVLSTVCQFNADGPPKNPVGPDPNARLGARCARPARCPPGWTYYRGTHKCFYVMPNPNKRWSNMLQFEQACQRPCGNLAEIHHVHENQFILNLARQKLFPKGVPNTPNLAHGLKASVWIGYHKAATGPCKFRWVDGSPCHYDNWCAGTPGRKEWYFRRQPDNNGGLESCTVMNLGSYCPGKWADYICMGPPVLPVAGAVCQIRLAGNPPPLPPPRKG